jgi:hypothetical protein
MSALKKKGSGRALSGLSINFVAGDPGRRPSGGIVLGYRSATFQAQWRFGANEPSPNLSQWERDRSPVI